MLPLSSHQINSSRHLFNQDSFLRDLNAWVKKDSQLNENRLAIYNIVREAWQEGLQALELDGLECQITQLPPIPSSVTSLILISFNRLTSISNLSPSITTLGIVCCDQLAFINNLPDNLQKLTLLDCGGILFIPDYLFQNPIFHSNTPFYCHSQHNVWNQLRLYIQDWKKDTTVDLGAMKAFKKYFLSSERMWGCSQAIANPAAFAKIQLKLLAEMKEDAELRDECFILATAGLADCHDNALAMFIQMQETALKIAMAKPHILECQLINYGLLLENQHALEKCITSNPHFNKVIRSQEGLEAKLLLQYMCHEINLPLPANVTVMNNMEFAVNLFRLPDDGQDHFIFIYEDCKSILGAKMPSKKRRRPTPLFLAAQPFWQHYLDKKNSLFIHQKEKIQANTGAEFDRLENELFALEKHHVTDANNDAISSAKIDITEKLQLLEQECQRSITDVYLEETNQILSMYF